MASPRGLPLAILVSLFLCLCTLVSADSSGDYFTYPATNNSVSSIPNQGHVTLVEGTKTVITWYSTFDNGALYLSQDGNGSPALLPNSGNIADGTYIWVVDISGTNGNPTFDLSKGANFTFSIAPNGTDAAGITGATFHSGTFTIASTFASPGGPSGNAASLVKEISKGGIIGLGIGLIAALGVWP